MPKRTYQPSKIKRKKKLGFRARPLIVKKRRKKGRRKLAE